MPRLSKEAWIVIRAEFESGGTRSLRVLGEKYGITEKAIRLQAGKTDQEGGPWTRPPLLRDQMAKAVGKAVERIKETREPSMEKGEAIAKKLRKRQADIAEVAIEPAIIIEEFTNPPNSAAPEPPPPPSETETPQAESATPHRAECAPRPPEPEPEPAQPKPEQPPPKEPQPVEQHPLFEAAAFDATLSMQERVLGDAMRSLVAVNLAHLDERVEPLKKLFARQLDLLTRALATPADDDVDGQADRDQARKALLGASRDSISGQIAALVRLSESIQQQERRALGMEGPAARFRPTAEGPGNVPRQGDGAAAADAMPDLSSMDTEQLETLYQAAVVLEGQRERPPILLPPGRRVVIEGEQEVEPPKKE